MVNRRKMSLKIEESIPWKIIGGSNWIEEEKMSSWIEESIPWKILEAQYRDSRKTQSKLANDLTLVGGTKPELPLALTGTNTEPSDSFIMSKLFRENGRPNLCKYSKNIHLWILYYVTRGRYRADKNKNVYHFAGTPNTNDDIVWQQTILENNDKWRKVSDPFPMLENINDRCNQIYEDVLHKFETCPGNKTRDAFRTRLINLRRLPEFVAWQSHRSHVHKTNVWSFAGVRKGGNQITSDAEKSIPHRIQSVHWYLVKYHSHLGTISRKFPQGGI